MNPTNSHATPQYQMHYSCPNSFQGMCVEESFYLELPLFPTPFIFRHQVCPWEGWQVQGLGKFPWSGTSLSSVCVARGCFTVTSPGWINSWSGLSSTAMVLIASCWSPIILLSTLLSRSSTFLTSSPNFSNIFMNWAFSSACSCTATIHSSSDAFSLSLAVSLSLTMFITLSLPNSKQVTSVA